MSTPKKKKVSQPGAADLWVATWLHQYGHLQVPLKDLPKLSVNDTAMQSAVSSIQAFDANGDNCSLVHHNRNIEPDGLFGPATAQLMSLPRCGDRDPTLEERAEEAKEFASMGMTEAATGVGSWPVPGCNPDDSQRNSRHSVRLYVDSRRATSKQKSYLDRCIRGVQECCAEAGLQVYIVNNKADAELSLAFESIKGNVIGYFYLYNLGANTCNTSLRGMLDVNYEPDWYQFCLLIVHEALGHGLGHQHTSGGIMNPSLLRTPTRPGTEWPTYKNDGSSGNTAWRRMTSWFGGQAVPVPGVDPVDPVDPVPDGNYVVTGELQVRVLDGTPGGKPVTGKLIVVPK